MKISTRQLDRRPNWTIMSSSGIDSALDVLLDCGWTMHELHETEIHEVFYINVKGFRLEPPKEINIFDVDSNKLIQAIYLWKRLAILAVVGKAELEHTMGDHAILVFEGTDYRVWKMLHADYYATERLLDYIKKEEGD